MLQLFSGSFGHGSRHILCGNDSALQLVYAAVQEGRAQHAQRLVLKALTTSAAAQQLRVVAQGRGRLAARRPFK